MNNSPQSSINIQVGSLKNYDQYYHNRMPSFKQMTLYDLLKEVRGQKSQFSSLSKSLVESSQMISKLNAKNQDKIQYLERQIKYQQDNDPQQEKYIEDLEEQLKETRTTLLDNKMKLTDKEEEVKSLKKQIQSLSISFNQLEEQKREIDQLVIKVSQELKSKEYDIRDYNYQLAQEKEHLTKQVEIMKKELQEEKERRSSLELVEGDLIHKLQQKENEIIDCRNLLPELEDKLSLKTEAIEKAQKVIQMLNEEIDKSINVIARIEQERDQLKNECKEQSRRIIDLNKQLSNQIASQQQQQSQVSQQLKGEIQELREALHSYQQEYDEEKRQLQDTLREVNEQKYTIQIEKEKLDYTQKKQISYLQDKLSTIEAQNDEYKLKIVQIEKELKQNQENYQQQIQYREEQANNQIRYLQKRLKEVGSSQGGAEINKAQTQAQQNDITAYLSVIRQEYEKALNEIIETRNILKQESNHQQSEVMVKLRAFEDFNQKVLQTLNEYEQKVEELQKVGDTYRSQLDDQKKLFVQMKQLMRDKDILISNLQKQMKSKEQALLANNNTIKSELVRSSTVIQEDLLEFIKNQENKMKILYRDNYDSEQRFQTFKYEYAKLLDERQLLKEDNYSLTAKLDQVTSESEILTKEYFEFVDKIRIILGLNSQKTLLQEVLGELEKHMDELKIKRDEVINYKDKLSTQKIEIDEEKVQMQNRIIQVESQIEAIYKKHLAKEEELQVQFLHKETKLTNEVQRQQVDLTSQQSQLDKQDKKLKKYKEKLHSQKEQIQSLESENIEHEKIKTLLNSEQEKIQEYLTLAREEAEQNKQELQFQISRIQEIEDEKKKQEDRLKYLKDSILNKEIELQRERDLNLQLQDEKYRAVNNYEKEREKCEAFEREAQSLYKELQSQKQTIKDLSIAFQEVEREKLSLKHSYDQMHGVVEDAQNEINQSQNAIENLNNALEKSKKKISIIKDLKGQVKQLKTNERNLQEYINDLKRQLYPARSSVEVQTSDSALQEIEMMREEFILGQKQQYIWQKECEQIREALQRQSNEIDRLIEEKRDLEDLVEQQNQSIKQIRLNNAMKENINYVNQPKQSQYIGEQSVELYSKILQEKENYIMRLEAEMSEMRKEIECLKERLISYEIGNLSSIEKSLNASSGLPLNLRSQQYHIAKRPILKGTNYSLNMSNIYGQTPTTNCGTLQNVMSEDTKTMGKSLNKSFHY